MAQSASLPPVEKTGLALITEILIMQGLTLLVASLTVAAIIA